jgi:hypothetical protein
LVWERGPPPPPPAPPPPPPHAGKWVGKRSSSYRGDDDSDNDEEEGQEDGAVAPKPSRLPAEGDVVFVKWDEDPREYLCLVGRDKKGDLVISSADASFKGTLDFVPSEDVWRFSEGSTLQAPKVNKRKLAPNALDVKDSREFKEVVTAANSRVMEGLKFVIAGETAEMPGELFGMTVHTLIEACGGTVTGVVSGVTDYLVCGTILYNPFLGTRGKIENGSKYKAAMTRPQCKIISYEQLKLLCTADLKSV